MDKMRFMFAMAILLVFVVVMIFFAGQKLSDIAGPSIGGLILVIILVTFFVLLALKGLK